MSFKSHNAIRLHHALPVTHGCFAAVPYDALRLTNQNQHFILDVELVSLDSVPSFDNESWPNMNDSHWVTKIREYYGSGFAPENES
ncbi:hypothetical protein OAP14_02230 [Aliiglaciecola sp.]|nr:hypothetical protein [Aliiglaciecola sp.]